MPLPVAPPLLNPPVGVVVAEFEVLVPVPPPELDAGMVLVPDVPVCGVDVLVVIAGEEVADELATGSTEVVAGVDVAVSA